MLYIGPELFGIVRVCLHGIGAFGFAGLAFYLRSRGSAALPSTTA